MLTTIEGPVGTGKTLYLVAKACKSKRQIVSNFLLKSIDYSEFSMYDFVSAKYEKVLMLLDEVYSIADSRFSMSNQNSAASYQIFQARKKSLDIYATLQLTRTVDVRFREMADRRIRAMGLRNVVGGKAYKYYIKENGVKTKSYINLNWAKYLYDLYNTREVIQPTQIDLTQFKTKQEQREDIKIYANKVQDYYGSDKITRGMIDYYLYNETEITFTDKFLNRIYNDIKVGKLKGGS